MPYKELISQRKKDFDAAFEFAKSEAAAIRTGRANPSLVEDLQVEYMGSQMRVKELASISTPEPRVIVIQPWDPTVVPAIEKSIRESTLGLNPANDGHAIRLTIPPLTEERRKEFIKILHQKMEEARIRIRGVREDVLKKVQNEVREKKAREDDLRLAKDELQKIIDDLHKKIDEMVKKKEQELMTA
ncbi:MAG TPA: ribosome recycling factor [Candidatus Paceibacterota bacterium]|nr:ribosome recycling factor [Candidatus Paceibacterota bacterium]